MTEPFFPFTIFAHDNGHYVQEPWGFRRAFLKIKPEGLTWYTFNVTIKSPTEVEFTTYGMYSFSTGGIGKKEHTFSATLDIEITREAITNEARRRARLKRQQELDEAENAVIETYTSAIIKAQCPEVLETANESA